MVTVKDFGQGMTPAVTPFRNDPQGIIYSENFFSLSPDGRQLRYGVAELIDYDSIVVAVTDSSEIDALTNYAPPNDSGSLVFMAGSHWWYNYYGERITGRIIKHVDTIQGARRIERYHGGTIQVTAGSNQIKGSGTRFIRHLASGDTLIAADNNDTFVVRQVVSDTLLLADSLTDLTADGSTTWKAYPAYSGEMPYLYASGDYCFTGSPTTKPQVIYTHNDSLFIRPLVMVDSFYVDSVYSFYADSLGGNEIRTGFQITGNDTIISSIKLVSKRSNWEPNEWLETFNETPVTYFVRIGWHVAGETVRGKFHPIKGNTINEMFLHRWYVSDTLGNATLWRDSTLSGKGFRMQDTMTTTYVQTNPWAYIYTAVGAFETIVDDENTGSITMYGRGAVMKITDTSTFFIHPDSICFDGMYFVHLTTDASSFPSYDISSITTNTYTITRDLCSTRPTRPLTQDELPSGDTIISSVEYPDQNAANQGAPCSRWVYTIKSTRGNITPVEADYVNKSYFPIQYAVMDNDTLYMVSSTAEFNMLAGHDSVITSDWEFLKAGMPSFAGMASWGNTEQLVAWGDSSAGSIVSMAAPGEPWDWSAQRDLIVGDPAEPVTGALGYDDEMVFWKSHSMVGYANGVFSERSQTDGLVGPRAFKGLSKEVFWLDVDGLKWMSRRDFNGYSIKKISGAMDPVFNTWSSSVYGSERVPFTINPAYRHKAVLEYSTRDEHLYLFFPEGTDTVNTKCVTFTRDGKFDGYFSIRAADAEWMVFNDTARIVIASPDSSLIGGMDFSYNDYGAGFDSKLTSSRFWITDKNGWPVIATLKSIKGLFYGTSGGFDSGRVSLYANNSMTNESNADTAYHGSITNFLNVTLGTNFYIDYVSTDLTGTYWNWEIFTAGKTSSASVFEPYELQFEFIPVGREH